jgi:glycosyltransferase involved in cell wall biosynthesis
MKLSFLIPAYNSADVLDDAVASALAQDVGIVSEIVIVDDASTDRTRERALSWERRAPDMVRVGTHDQNRGGAAARNTAAALADGELLYIVDADNVLSDGCVRSQVGCLEATGLDAISVGQVYYFEHGTTDITDGWVQRHTDGRSTVRHLFESNKVPPAHGNYLFTRRLFDAAGGYPEEAGAMDTWAFGLRHLARGFDIGIDRNSHYLHRLNRPGHDSYWSREEERGTNDANAMRALDDEAARLPSDLRELVERLEPGDRFHALVRSGAFRGDASRLRDVRRVERIEHATLSGVRRTLQTAARIRDALPTR